MSLQWAVSGGFAGVNESYTIQNHEIIKPDNRGHAGGGVGISEYRSPPQVVPMSENQWKELLDQLKKANVPATKGNYRQEALADGFNETLDVTLSDGDNRDQKFTVSNYGNKAPATFYVLKTYLNTLLQRKLPATIVTPTKVAPASATPK